MQIKTELLNKFHYPLPMKRPSFLDSMELILTVLTMKHKKGFFLQIFPLASSFIKPCWNIFPLLDDLPSSFPRNPPPSWRIFPLVSPAFSEELFHLWRWMIHLRARYGTDSEEIDCELTVNWVITIHQTQMTDDRRLLFEDGEPLTFGEFMDAMLTLRGSNSTTVKDIAARHGEATVNWWRPLRGNAGNKNLQMLHFPSSQRWLWWI